MGIKFVIKGELKDVPRLLEIPRSGDVVELGGVKYDVILVHHKIDSVSQYGRGDILVHLKKIPTKSIQSSTSSKNAINLTIDSGED